MTESSNASQHWRFGLVTYGIVLAVAISAYIFISLVEVDYSFYVQGSSHLTVGQPNAVRGLVRNVQTGRRQAIEQLDVTLTDAPGFDRYQRLDASEHSPKESAIKRLDKLPASPFVFSVSPNLEPSEQRLVLEARDSSFGILRAETGVTLTAPRPRQPWWPPKTSRHSEDEQPPSELTDRSAGPIAIAIFPPDGEIVEGIQNPLQIATYEKADGEPLSCSLRLSTDNPVANLEQKSLSTGVLGLGQFNLQTFADTRIEIKVQTCEGSPNLSETLPETTTRTFPTVTAQVAFSTPTPIATKGDSVNLHYRSLFDSGRVYLDLYHQTDWLEAYIDQSGANSSAPHSIEVTFPKLKQTPMFVRVQLYRSLFSPGDAWDIQRILIRRSGESRLAAMRRLLRFVERHSKEAQPWLQYLTTNPDSLDKLSTDQIGKLTSLLLLLIPRNFEPPPELVDTESFAQQRLAQWKQSVNSQLYDVIAVLFGLGLIVFVFWFGSTRMAGEQTEITADAEAGDLELEDARNPARDWLVGVGFFLLLSSFAAGVLILLSYM
jgi:hypothetical protein